MLSTIQWKRCQFWIIFSVILYFIIFIHNIFYVHSLYNPCQMSNDSLDLNTLDGPKSAPQVLSVAQSFEDHLQIYYDRYHYHPPIPYSNHTARQESCGEPPHFETYLSAPRTKERSANDEDRIIYEIFFKGKNQIEESILEIGAFDGVRESNSRFFDLCLGWKTLLVEGNPLQYVHLVKNRPHAHLFNFVPGCTEEDELMNKTVKFDKARYTNGGLADGSVETAYTHDNVTGTVNVPCGSLTKVLLDVFPYGHVSFFSLDVEGSEPSIVQHLDFDRIYIEIIMIENFNSFCPRNDDCKSRNEFRKIMKEAGYVRFEDVVPKSDLFIHPSSRHLVTARKKGFTEKS